MQSVGVPLQAFVLFNNNNNNNNNNHHRLLRSTQAHPKAQEPFINLLNSFPTLIATYRYKFDLHCPIYHFQFRSIVTASASTC